MVKRRGSIAPPTLSKSAVYLCSLIFFTRHTSVLHLLAISFPKVGFLIVSSRYCPIGFEKVLFLYYQVSFRRGGGGGGGGRGRLRRWSWTYAPSIPARQASLQLVHFSIVFFVSLPPNELAAALLPTPLNRPIKGFETNSDQFRSMSP